MKKILSTLVIGCACLWGAQSVQAQGIAVRTNLASWAVLGANVGVDLVTTESTSLGISFYKTMGKAYPLNLFYKDNKHIKIFDSHCKDVEVTAFQFEGRYWFAHQPMQDFFVGLTVSPAHYKLTHLGGGHRHDQGSLPVTDGDTDEDNNFPSYLDVKHKPHKDSGMAFPMGINIGYSWPLNQRLNLEACYGVGYTYYVYKNVQAGVHHHTFNFSTTNVGVNITYILK